MIRANKAAAPAAQPRGEVAHSAAGAVAVLHDQRSVAIAQRALVQAIEGSPRMAAQRALCQRPQGRAGADPASVIQRVVGPRPDGVFNANLAWATWFGAMTDDEVREQANALGLAPAALVGMSDLLLRHGEPAIAVPPPDRLASDPASIDTDVVMAESAKGLLDQGLSMDAVDGTQSPFRFGSVARQVSSVERPARDYKARRRELASPVNFTIYCKVGESDRYEAKDRKKSLSTLAKPDFDLCFARAAEAVLHRSGTLVITLAPGRHILFDTANAELLGEELAALYAVRYEEAEPRSGAARAAPDELEGSLRHKREVEAPYAAPTEDLGEAESWADYQAEEGDASFSSTIQQGMVCNTIVHRGPWAKGERVPSQMGVMGGQNAKNYFLDQFMRVDAPPLGAKEKQEDLDEIGGRFEWLHVIGSSLGGPNVLGNLVCGTYDANTEMIALEHRVALWGQRGYRGSFAPTPDKPIKIVGIALLEGSGFVAKQIVLLVYHGAELVMRREYATLQEAVLTKAKYRAAELQIESDIKLARGGAEDDSDEKL